MTRLLLPALVLAAFVGLPSNAAAQNHVDLMRSLLTPFPTSGAMPNQVFSSNPIGLAFEFYNFDYEVRTSDSVTVGAGASRLGWRPFDSTPPKPYLNGDVFVRFYPGGQAFNGLALGLKAGLTQFPGGGRYPGLGFDMNQSATLNEHLVMSAGFGLKRLARDTPGVRTIPTLRFNVGVGF